MNQARTNKLSALEKRVIPIFFQSLTDDEFEALKYFYKRGSWPVNVKGQPKDNSKGPDEGKRDF